MCLCCGHTGPELQGTSASSVLVCPACGEALYARPPRSYAELEGLAEEAPPTEPGDLVGSRAGMIAAIFERTEPRIGRVGTKRAWRRAASLIALGALGVAAVASLGLF